MVTPRRTYIFALAAKFPLPFIHLNEFSRLGNPTFSHNNVIIIEIADSAQTEYCTTFHCPSVRSCVTVVTSHISHIYKGINAMLIIRGPIKPYIFWIKIILAIFLAKTRPHKTIFFALTNLTIDFDFELSKIWILNPQWLLCLVSLWDFLFLKLNTNVITIILSNLYNKKQALSFAPSPPSLGSPLCCDPNFARPAQPEANMKL